MNPGIQDILILEPLLSSGEGFFYRERGESRVASRLTDFSESEEDLSSDDPEQEGAALDVRSAAKERRGIGCPRAAAPGKALKKNTQNGPDTNKRNKKRAMMMILCSFSPCPDDALLARGATYQKKNLSITLRRESLV